MRKLLRQVFITALGFLLSFVFLLGIVWGAILLKSKSALLRIPKNSILHIPLQGTMVEHTPHASLQALERGNKAFIDLIVLKKAIQAAQKDERIQGIYLEVGNLVAGWASLEELRAALQHFRESGKFIIAYGEHYDNKNYYVSSLADEIMLHPSGTFLFNGLHLTVLFYKQLLDKLEVNPQVFRVGRYKSAIEPFTSSAMSEFSKQQTSILLDNIYEHMLHKIALSRDLTVAGLKEIANNLLAINPQDTYKASLITHIGHWDDVEVLIKNKLNLKIDADIKYIDFDKYASEQKDLQNPKSKIAVLVASGVIVNEPTMSPTNNLNSKNFIDELRRLRLDPTVKAIVLRINSPGGSAVASESMWKELILTKAVKPVVASMADVAASGGYYLASGCQYIFGLPTTITGSIGIYSLYFNVDRLLKNKMGITIDEIKTSPSADLFKSFRPMTVQEKAVIQKQVEQGYHTFLARVATGRQLTQAAVGLLAEGRVWPGNLAQEQGLIDELGGLEKAIEKAAELAGLSESYSIAYWPKPKTWFEGIWMELTNTRSNGLMSIISKWVTSRWGFQELDLRYIPDLDTPNEIQARMPYSLEMN